MLACISSPYIHWLLVQLVLRRLTWPTYHNSIFQTCYYLLEDICILIFTSPFVTHILFGFQDPSYIVRKSFICKLYGLLKRRAIPVRYACALALASTDCSGDVRAEVNVLFSFLYLCQFSIYICHATCMCSRGFPVLLLVSKLLKWSAKGAKKVFCSTEQSKQRFNCRQPSICCGFLDPYSSIWWGTPFQFLWRWD